MMKLLVSTIELRSKCVSLPPNFSEQIIGGANVKKRKASTIYDSFNMQAKVTQL
jgi:hypothetical protein